MPPVPISVQRPKKSPITVVTGIPTRENWDTRTICTITSVKDSKTTLQKMGKIFFKLQDFRS